VAGDDLRARRASASFSTLVMPMEAICKSIEIHIITN
jgi:hypothetical protein